MLREDPPNLLYCCQGEVTPVHRRGRIFRQGVPQVLVQRLAEEWREGRHDLDITMYCCMSTACLSFSGTMQGLHVILDSWRHT